MKSQFMHLVLTAGLTVLGSLTLSAQDQTETAKVPFAFHANENSFAAGEYRVDRIDSQGLFQLTSQNDGRSIFVPAPLSMESKAASDPHLTFACYQGDCVLKEIWVGDGKIGYSRSDSAVEKDIQRKLGMAAMIHVRLTK
jgi:hypothetical protein